jgi:hypothetical protein
LQEVNFSKKEIKELVHQTGPTKGREYGHTYSDITQRILPGMVLAAFPDRPITFELAKQVVEAHPPTPPFTNSAS